MENGREIRSLDELGYILQVQRKSKKLVQTDMNMATGLSQQHYQTIEAGADLKVSTLLRIAEGLGLEVWLRPRQKGIGDARPNLANDYFDDLADENEE